MKSSLLSTLEEPVALMLLASIFDSFSVELTSFFGRKVMFEPLGATSNDIVCLPAGFSVKECSAPEYVLLSCPV